MWQWWVELCLAAAYGLASSMVPVLNNEAFLVATQGFGVARVVPAVLGLSLGNGVGKVLLLAGLRAGRRIPTPERGRRISWDRERHPYWDAALRWWGEQRRRILGLMDRPGWSLPVTFLSAITGVPPLYAVTVVAVPTTMNSWLFGAVCTAGSAVRFGLLAAAMLGIVHWG